VQFAKTLALSFYSALLLWAAGYLPRRYTSKNDMIENN